jgi:hypothetical protein
MCRAKQQRRSKLSKPSLRVDSTNIPEVEIPPCMLQYLEDHHYYSLDNIESTLHVDGSDNYN